MLCSLMRFHNQFALNTKRQMEPGVFIREWKTYLFAEVKKLKQFALCLHSTQALPSQDALSCAQARHMSSEVTVDKTNVEHSTTKILKVWSLRNTRTR